MANQATHIVPDKDWSDYQSEDFNRSWDEAQAPFDQAEAFGKDWEDTEARLEAPTQILSDERYGGERGEGGRMGPGWVNSNPNGPSLDRPQRPRDPNPGTLPPAPAPEPPTDNTDALPKDVIFGDKYDPALAPTGEQDPTFWEQAREKLSDPNEPTVLPGLQRLSAAVTSGKGIPGTPEEALKRAEDVTQSTNVITPFGVYNPQIAQGLASGMPGIEGGGLEGLVETATEKLGIHPTNIYDRALQKALAEASPELRASLEAANRTPSGGTKYDIRNVGALLERAIADRMAPANAVSPGVEAELSALLGARAAAGAETMHEFGPAIRVAGEDYAYLNTLMGLQKYIDASIAKENPERFGVFAKSLEDARSQVAAMEEHLGPERWQNLLNADALRQGAQDKLLDDVVTAGLIPKDLADKIRAELPHYSPTAMIRYIEKDNTGIRGAGNNLTQRWNTFKKLSVEGSSDDQMSPMQATFKAAIERHIAIQKNHAMQTLAADGGFKVSPVRQGQQPTGLAFRQEGKLVQMDVPKDIKNAIEGFDNETLNGFAAFMSALNKPLRMGATQLNPTFIAANAGADYIQAYIREALTPGTVGRGYEAAFNRTAIYDLMVRRGAGTGAEGSWMQGGMRGVSTEIDLLGPLKKKPLISQVSTLPKMVADMEKEIVNAGGVVVGRGDFQKLLRRIEQGSVDAPISELVKSMLRLGPIRTVGSAIEQGPRVATFAKHLEGPFEAAMGRKSSNWDELAAWAETQPIEVTAPAAMAARRVTVDFSRIGQYMRSMNAMVPFLNAQVQGSLNTLRTLGVGQDKGENLTVLGTPNKEAIARLGGLMALSLSLAIWNRTHFAEEDADVPDYLKESTIYVLMPGSERNPNGLGFKKISGVFLPVRSYGAFTQAVNEMVRAVQSQDPDLIGAIGRVGDATNPFPGDPILRDIRPAPVASFSSIKENKNPFTGQDIVPQSEKERLATTPWLQYGPQTTELAKRLSKAVADMPDIPVVSDFLRDYFSSPRQIDYFIKANTGGAGQRAEEAISQAMGQESTTPPVVGGLLRTIYRDYGGAIQQKAYEKRDKDLAKLHRENGDLGDWVVRNVDHPISEPPTSLSLTSAYDHSSLGSVFLLPDEQVRYQEEFLKALREGVMDFQDLIKDEPLTDRKLDMQEVVSEARDLAKEKTLDSLSDDEIDRRLTIREENPIPQSHRQAREEFQPLGAR